MKQPIITVHPFFIENLKGMNNRQDWDKIPDESCLLSLNIMHDNTGTWGTRGGVSLLGTTQIGSGVQGLIEYTDSNKINYIKAIRSGDIDYYDNANNVFVQEEANTFMLGVKVAQVQFLGRTYQTSPSTYLRYNTNGITTEISDDGNRVKGETLSVAQGTMFVGIGSTIYYTDFDGATNLPTDRLWKFDESGLTASTNKIVLNEPHTAQFSYGVTGLNYIFTKKACYVFDIKDTGSISKVFDIGCAGPRAVGVINNVMIFMSPDGRQWAWGGQKEPKNISFAIEDETNNESLTAAINKSTIADVAFGAFGNNFWFSIGTITVYNQTITNACIYGFVLPNFSEIYYSVHQFPVLPSIFLNTTIMGVPVLLFGSSTTDDIYQMFVATTDDGTAIISYVYTKFYQYGTIYMTQKPISMVTKFRPKQIQAYLKVSYALDMINDYTIISDPDSNITNFGVVNLFDSNPQVRSKRCLLGMPEGARGTSISYKFESNHLDLQGFGGKFTLGNLDLNIKSV